MISPLWNRVTVVGCGLIGASVALALKRNGVCRVLAGWDSSPVVLDEALRLGVIDEVDVSFSSHSTSHSDLFYLAMPVGEIITFLRECGSRVKTGAVITDAGSTKGEICAAARAYLPPTCSFIGGHPVAGSHLRGIAHASAELFTGRPYILIAAEDGEGGQPFNLLCGTVNSFGARLNVLKADEHDRAMAFVSHVPQLLSSALAMTVREEPNAGALLELSGTGYRDMTRLSESSWSVWQDTFATNSDKIGDALEKLIEKLVAARDELRLAEGSVAADLPTLRGLFEQSQRH
jgi:prephenate dehydrogenase